MMFVLDKITHTNNTMYKPKYTIVGKTIYFSTNFDEDMESYYIIMRDMNELMFVDTDNSWFNKPIILTPNITHLIFGNRFNQSIVLARVITKLCFGNVSINRLF